MPCHFERDASGNVTSIRCTPAVYCTQCHEHIPATLMYIECDCCEMPFHDECHRDHVAGVRPAP